MTARKFAMLKYQTIIEISYTITLRGRVQSLKPTVHFSMQVFFLRIYCSFSLSKESKSYCDPEWQRSTASTSFHQKVKKVQIASLLFATLESITREQDVITSLMTYYISHALPSHWMTGGIFQSRAALRNRTLTENKCLTHF